MLCNSRTPKKQKAQRKKMQEVSKPEACRFVRTRGRARSGRYTRDKLTSVTQDQPDASCRWAQEGSDRLLPCAGCRSIMAAAHQWCRVAKGNPAERWRTHRLTHLVTAEHERGRSIMPLRLEDTLLRVCVGVDAGHNHESLRCTSGNSNSNATYNATCIWSHDSMSHDSVRPDSVRRQSIDYDRSNDTHDST